MAFVYLLNTVCNNFHKDSLIILAVLTADTMLIYFIPESPRWLVANGYLKEAVNTLKCLRGQHSALWMISLKISTLLQVCEVFHNNYYTLLALIFLSTVSAATSYSTLILKVAGVPKLSGTEVFAGISGVGMLLATVMLGTHVYITRPSACLKET